MHTDKNQERQGEGDIQKSNHHLARFIENIRYPVAMYKQKKAKKDDHRYGQDRGDEEKWAGPDEIQNDHIDQNTPYPDEDRQLGLRNIEKLKEPDNGGQENQNTKQPRGTRPDN